MPTRVLLEGPAIEPLLAQVQEEYGSGVRIVSADKVRSGGLGGFFAKQHYELSVEIPDSTEDKTPTVTPPAGREPAHTLEQLLERAESQDRIAPDAPDAPAAAVVVVADTEPAPNAAFADLLAGLDAANQIAGSASPRPSPRAKAVPAKSEETPAVRPFRPATVTGSPVNGGGARPPVQSLAELMGGPAVSRSETPAPVRSAAETYGLNPPAAPDNAPVIKNLLSVGMPEAMAAQITGGDTYAAVLTALATHPAAPDFPDGHGDILVLAGDMGAALSIGRDLLARAGIDQTRLLLAGPSAAGTGLHSSRVMHTAEEAAARAEKLQASDSAWIIALDAPVGGTDPIWVSDMCDALGATALWALVDATRKTPDTARHLRTLGQVEALVVHGVELTDDPASVLGLDLPIVSLDGKPATPHAWAAMLCARIASDFAPQATAPRRQVRSAR